MGPNVLLIVFDTARADAFEPYGAAAGSSPTVSQLAARGQAYEAFAPAPWTIPTHASMFSGLLPRAAGMPGACPTDMMISATRAALPRLEERWLPAVLAASGYQTAGVSSNGLVSPDMGFGTGFDQFRELESPWWCSWTGPAGWALQALRAQTDEGAGEVERILDEWLRDADRKPFFWFINLTECHSPYMPRAPHNPLRAWGRVRASQEWGRYLRGDAWRMVFGGSDVPARALARMRRLYAGEVLLLDTWLARVLDSLDRHGVLDETIVIVTSDHGENLGENGLMGHGFSLDDRLIRVPFVVAGPAETIPGPRFSLVDLPGWVAGSCGIKDHPWQVSNTEIAVAQFDAYGRPDDPWVIKAVNQWGIGDLGLSRLTEDLTCATNGRRKLVRLGDREELFDLDIDPLEQSPITIDSTQGQSYNGDLDALRSALDKAAEMVSVRTARDIQIELPPLDTTDLEARMRMLGYM